MQVTANLPVDEMGNYWVCTTRALEPVLNGPQVKQNSAGSSTGCNSPSKGEQGEQSRRRWDDPYSVEGSSGSHSQASFADQKSNPPGLFFSSLMVDSALSFHSPHHPPHPPPNPHRKIPSHFIAEFSRKIMFVHFTANLGRMSLFHKVTHWYIHGSELQAHSLPTVVFQAG